MLRLSFLIFFIFSLAGSIYSFDNNPVFSLSENIYNPVNEIYGFDPNYSLEKGLKIDYSRSRTNPVIYHIDLDFDNKTVSVYKMHRDSTILSAYIYGEMYEYIDDVIEISDRKSWLNVFGSSYGMAARGARDERLAVSFQLGRLADAEKYFGPGDPTFDLTGLLKAKFDLTYQRNQHLEGALDAATGGSSRSVDPNFDLEADIEGKVAIGTRLTLDFRFKNKQDLFGDGLYMKLRYGGQDSLELEDHVLQEVEIGNNIDFSIPTLSLIQAGGYNDVIGIKSRWKIGHLNLAGMIGFDEGSAVEVEEQIKAGGDPVDSKRYNTTSHFFLDKYYADLFRERQRYSDPITVSQEFHIDSIKILVSKANETQMPTWANQEVPAVFKDYENGVEKDDYEPREQFFVLQRQFFDLNREKGYIRINEQAMRAGNILNNRTIAVIFTTGDQTFTSDMTRPVGNDSVYTARLIKPANTNNLHSLHPYHSYKWTNVYKMPTDFETEKVKIYRLDKDGNRVYENNRGVSYSQLLSVAGANDDILNARVLDNEYLVFPFPNQKPFMSELIEREYRDSTIYDTSIVAARNTFSIEFIGDRYEITLQNTPVTRVMEVKSGGATLTEGVDYTVDLFAGKINLISARAKSGNEDVVVKYRYEPFFVSERTIIGGMHSSINLTNVNPYLGDRSSLHAAIFYRAENSGLDNPEIGRESFSNMIFGMGMNLGYSTPILTDLALAIPTVETETDSRIDFKAEAARIHSNPNRDSEFSNIDDFENAKLARSVPIDFVSWTYASNPKGSTDAERDFDAFWYNPYREVPYDSIWPSRQMRPGSNSTRVLNFRTGEHDSSSYAGFMRYVDISGAVDYDFLEVTLRSRNIGDEPSLPGKLYFDIGQVSEDINDNGELDFEGRPNVYDFSINSDEDTGFVGFTRRYEYIEEEARKGTDQGNYLAYRYINAFAGNGRRNSEDLNRNQILDTISSFYRFEIDISELDDSYFYVERLANGWYTVRIPLDLIAEDENGPVSKSIVGQPSRNRFRYMRIWADGVYNGTREFQIASMDFTGNNWEPLILSEFDDSLAIDQNVYVSTINSEDNFQYVSPRGLEMDRDGYFKKEEAIKIDFENIFPNQAAAIRRSGYSLNLLRYDYYSLFVWPDKDYEQFFVRLVSSQGYYEVEIPVVASAGNEVWNDISIDLKDLVAKKLHPTDTVFTDGDRTIRIHGDPNLAMITDIVMGVKNSEAAGAINGSIILNDMRVSGFETDPGHAFTVSVSNNIADVFTTNASMDYRDHFFHGLADRYGSGNANMNASLSNTLNLHKFYLERIGFTIPVNTSISRSIMRPGYSGDIFLGYDSFSDIWDDFSMRHKDTTVSEDFQTLTNSRRISTSMSRARQHELELIDYFVNPYNVFNEFMLIRSDYQLSFNLSDHLSPIKLDTTRRYVGSWGLDLGKSSQVYNPLGSKPRDLNAGGIFYDFGFVSGFNLKIDQDVIYAVTKSKIFSDLHDPESDINYFDITRELIVGQRLSTGYNFFNLINTSFTGNIQRNLSDDITSYVRNYGMDNNVYSEMFPKAFKMKNPGKIDGIFYNERSHNQNLNMTFNPDLIAFITTRSTYSSGFSQGLTEVIDDDDDHSVDRTLLSLNYNNQLNLRNSLKLARMFSLSSRTENIAETLRKYRVSDIDFNYARTESYTIGGLDEDYYNFLSYTELFGYQHGFNRDMMLFSSRQNRYFSEFYDIDQQSVFNITNRYSSSVSWVMLNIITTTWSPSWSDGSSEYIDYERNTTKAEYNIPNVNVNIRNPNILNNVFKRRNLRSSFSYTLGYEWNFDSTNFQKKDMYSWTILGVNGVLHWRDLEVSGICTRNWSYNGRYTTRKAKEEDIVDDDGNVIGVTFVEDSTYQTNMEYDNNWNLNLESKYTSRVRRNIPVRLRDRYYSVPVQEWSLITPFTISYRKTTRTNSPDSRSLNITATGKVSAKFWDNFTGETGLQYNWNKDLETENTITRATFDLTVTIRL